MVEAANLLQIVFSRGQKHATPISFGASISNNRFIRVFLINWMIYTPHNLEISISLDSSSSTVPSFRFRPLLRASHQLRPSGNRTYVLYNVIAPGGRRSFNRSYACCYIWVDGGINDRDASACASAFAARSAHQTLPRGVGFLREPIPASSSPADSRAPAAPWCSSPAA